MTHTHTPDCPTGCTRQVDVDHRTVTGTYRIVSKKDYGRRPHDKPLWFVFVFHAYKALVQLAGLVALAWIAKRLGLVVVPP